GDRGLIAAIEQLLDGLGDLRQLLPERGRGLHGSGADQEDGQRQPHRDEGMPKKSKCPKSVHGYLTRFGVPSSNPLAASWNGEMNRSSDSHVSRLIVPPLANGNRPSSRRRSFVSRTAR